MPSNVTITRIQVRQADKVDWDTLNPSLSVGELGLEIDTGQFKIGRGEAVPWSDIPYANNIDFRNANEFDPNFVLAEGYFAVEKDTGRMKIGALDNLGNGIIWNELQYATLSRAQTDKINEAHSWGNHALEGYITGVNWADIPDRPTDTQINNWNLAYSWGDHSTFNYLTEVAVAEVIGLPDALNAKSDVGHNHDDRYVRRDATQTIDMDVGTGVEWNFITADTTAVGVPIKINGNHVWHSGIFQPSNFANSVHTHVAGEISGLSTVATTNNYNDLINTPVLAAIATSGSYNDLSDLPAISGFDLVEFAADQASFPTTGLAGVIYVDESQNKSYRYNTGSSSYEILDETAIVWGDIGGDLINQTDLQNALNLKSDVGHTHAIADVTGLQTELNAIPTKADAVHTHVITDVDGLQLALDGKSEVGHTHTTTDITDFTLEVNNILTPQLNGISADIEKNFYPDSTKPNGLPGGEEEQALYSERGTENLYRYQGSWIRQYAKARTSDLDIENSFIDNRHNTHAISQNENCIVTTPVSGSLSVKSGAFALVTLDAGAPAGTPSTYTLEITDGVGAYHTIVSFSDDGTNSPTNVLPEDVQSAIESYNLNAIGFSFIGSVVDGDLQFFRSDGATFTIKETLTAGNGTGASATGNGFPDAFATLAGVVTPASNLTAGMVFLEVPSGVTQFTLADVAAVSTGLGIRINFANSVPLQYKGVTYAADFDFPAADEYKQLTFASDGTNFYAY